MTRRKSSTWKVVTLLSKEKKLKEKNLKKNLKIMFDTKNFNKRL